MGRVEHRTRGAGRISGALTGPDVPSPRPRSRRARPDPVRTTVRTIGEVFITLGVIVLLFVIYEVYWTDLVSAGKQRDATASLENQWETRQPDPQRRDHFEGLKEGDGFAKMYIPAFGPDYSFTIIEGTTEESLEVGPGHYLDTAYPGHLGNFSVAGHRVGKGAPFNELDALESCDAIIVETQNNWYIYRVLPMADEKQNWDEVKKTKPKCNVTGSQGLTQEVKALPDEYAKTVGREIVTPSQGSVIAPIPHQPDSIAGGGAREPLMTLTTCHPKFSDRQRLIIHAILVDQWGKDPAKGNVPPPEMKEG